MYTEDEIDISRSNLSAVVSNLSGPVCLLGGWAVYITVNQNFRSERERDYIGSRDIDLGFEMDVAWSDAQLQKSTFSKSIEVLKEMKYYGVGSRFVQHHDLETKRLLTEEESKKLPKYEMFDLFVDPIVDKIHPSTKKHFGLVPINEPLLANVFSGGQFVMSAYFGKKIMIPRPEVLVSMKINSVLNRNKEDKRIKDIADIYSLMWYSDTDFPVLKRSVQKISGFENVSSTISKFTDKNYSAVSQIMGIGKDEILRVINEMAE